MNDKWVQDWKYHADNSDTSKSDKEMFLQYKDLTHKEVEENEELCEEDWLKFCAVKPLFTSGKTKERFLETISDKRKAYYYMKYKLSMQIKSLVEDNKHKIHLDTYMSKAEAQLKLTSLILRCKRKRGSDESSGSEGSDMPELAASPTCVMMVRRVLRIM
jgi:hypothetical protein